MSDLRRYQLPLHDHQLAAALTAPEMFATVPLGGAADFSGFWSTLEKLTSEETDSAKWDRALAKPLHQALRGEIDRRTALDPRFWHWVTTQPLQEFVWLRWHGEAPAAPDQVLTASLAERFLGAASLRGVSRNAVARLFWTAETLWNSEDGYAVVETALRNQDFFQAIFERNLGLYPPAVIACLRALENQGEEARRNAVKRLNHYLTTVAVEALSVRDVEQLMQRVS